MPAKKMLPKKRRTANKKRETPTIVEEVEKFDDLAPRLHELLMSSPKGTRVYLSVSRSVKSESGSE